jgi:hypothetical protein
MEDLKIVPDKVAVEDKHVVDYPTDESKTDTDKQVSQSIPSRRHRKIPNTRSKDFLWE